MFKLSRAIVFGFLLVVGIGTVSVQAGDATFKLTNKAQYTIILKLFSQSRNWIWPGPTQHFTLDDDAEHDFALSCQNGENICFGGSYNSNDQPRYWGVGFLGDKGCNGCCLVCGNNVWHAWNLTEPAPYTCAHCNDGSCQCGTNTPDGLCVGRGGNDPAIGCQQQQ